MRRVLFAILLAATQSSCDSPDRLRHSIPEGLPAGLTVYYNSKWIECSVAVYQLDPEFMEQVRQRGLSRLNEATPKSWKSTPSFPDGYETPRWVADAILSMDCIEDEKLRTLFHRIANGNVGYFQIQETNSITLIAPEDGLVMVGGYE